MRRPRPKEHARDGVLILAILSLGFFNIFIEVPEKEVQSETHTSVDDTELFGREVPSHGRIPKDVSWQTSRTGLGVSKSSCCI